MDDSTEFKTLLSTNNTISIKNNYKGSAMNITIKDENGKTLLKEKVKK